MNITEFADTLTKIIRSNYLAKKSLQVGCLLMYSLYMVTILVVNTYGRRAVVAKRVSDACTPRVCRVYAACCRRTDLAAASRHLFTEEWGVYNSNRKYYTLISPLPGIGLIYIVDLTSFCCISVN